MPGLDELALSLNAVAARLRELGDGDLARELQTTVGRAVDPLKDRIPAALRPHLPDRYADTLSEELRIRHSASLGAAGDIAQVSVLASTTRQRKLAQSDAGILFHPVFGDRRDWREQQVTPGWFTGPVEDAAPQVRDAIEAALDDVMEKAAGKGP